MKRWILQLVIGLVVLGFGQIGLAAEPPITALALDPDEKLLLTGSQEGVQSYSWPELRPGQTVKTDLKQIHDIAFSPDGKTLALAGGTPGEEGTVEFWNWPIGESSRSVLVHDDLVYRVAWTADSQFLFTASHDAAVLQISAKTGQVVQRFSGHSQPVREIGLLEQDEILLSAGNDQSLRVWDAQTGKLIRSFNNHTGAIRDLAVGLQKTGEKALPLIATIAADKTLRLWQPTIGRMVRFKRFSVKPLALAVSPAAGTLYVTTSNGELLEIDSQTLEIRATRKIPLHRPISLRITQDGKSAVVAGSRGKIQMISLKHDEK